MPARAIGSGTIAFGLVSIPIKLFTSTAPAREIRFNQLHADCGSRVRQKLYCPEHDAVIPREEVVKGYEFAKGRYVTFTPEELKAVEQQASGDIAIEEFVPLDSIDPVYFDRAYYLAPDKGAGRAYNLLAEALRETGLSAVGTYDARGKQYLVCLRPGEQGLVMQQLHHAYEIRSFSDVPVTQESVKRDELKLAIQLIEQSASNSFEPDKYEDEVRERIEALIARKVEGEDITTVPTEAPRAQVIDLMDALKSSLGTEAKPTTKAAGKRRPAKKAARKGPKRSTRAGNKQQKKKKAKGGKR